MCLAVPMQIKKIIDEDFGTLEIDGTMTNVNLSLIEDPQINDYVIVHAGFAIEKLDEKEAQIRLDLFDELAEKQAFN